MALGGPSDTKDKRSKEVKFTRLFLIGMLAAMLLPSWSFAQDEDEPSWYSDAPWKREDRPFHFYPDPVDAKPKDVPKKKVQPKSFEQMTSVKQIREEHDRLLDVAVVNPSQQNVLAYHEFKTKMLAQSEKFSAVTQAVIWQNPTIDYNATNPVANFAQTSQRIQKNRDEEQLMRDLAKGYGIVFFYRGSCGPCHAQAPIFKLIQQRYGMEVLAVSLDGAPMPGFENARPDNGISKALTGGRGVEATPMSFLVSRDYKDITMLGAGVMGEDEILNRVRLLKTRTPETMYTPYWAGQQSSQADVRQ
jgi:conjugal transfer pilus assembly protein TraF